MYPNPSDVGVRWFIVNPEVVWGLETRFRLQQNSKLRGIIRDIRAAEYLCFKPDSGRNIYVASFIITGTANGSIFGVPFVAILLFVCHCFAHTEGWCDVIADRRTGELEVINFQILFNCEASF